MARDYKKEAKKASTKKRKDYRVALNKKRRELDIYGNGNGDKHVSHKGGKIVGLRDKTANLKDQPKRKKKRGKG